ncbi:hypothetical protein [Vaginisenegalia massiliensis]|uniref:hypothetical protein n=1 Tax=Vaginisenegalia massiliensis TaxID=2058294 RepID=UPI0013DE07B4|nr:hypothetical protein [Vaginisenegalia massiliensis]
MRVNITESTKKKFAKYLLITLLTIVTIQATCHFTYKYMLRYSLYYCENLKVEED